MAFKYLSIVVLAGGLLVAGCENQGYGTKQTIGAGTGAVLGGLAGATVSKSSSSATRRSDGHWRHCRTAVGSEIGHMDDQDRQKADTAVQQAHTAPIGQEITWNNPDSGNYGTVVPTREGTDSSGRYCCEYHHGQCRWTR